MQNIATSLIRYFPFVSLDHALVLLRITTAILFMAHAVTRIVLGTLPNFAALMELYGFPQPLLWVWGITIAELIAGTLLIAGRYLRWAAFTLFCIAAGGIVLIHWRLGWFVGEHGTGGSEYSVALILMLLVIAAADRERLSE